MGNELVPVSQGVMLTYDQAKEFVKAANISGLVKLLNEEEGLVRIQMGKELGLGPVTSLSAVYAANGRAALQANTMAALIKRARPRYDYKTLHRDNESACIEFFQDGISQGTSEFTVADATQAGLLPAKKDKNGQPTAWDKWRKAMLWARAISAGFRMYCGDLALAGNVYTPEELGSEDIIDISPEDVVVQGGGAINTQLKKEAAKKVEFEDAMNRAREALRGPTSPPITLPIEVEAVAQVVTNERANLQDGLAELNRFRVTD